MGQSKLATIGIGELAKELIRLTTAWTVRVAARLHDIQITTAVTIVIECGEASSIGLVKIEIDLLERIVADEGRVSHRASRRPHQI